METAKEPRCDPTVWHDMEKPVDGGREHYQERGWNPPFPGESEPRPRGAEEDGST
ncbi:MAG: hypothetical protein Kow0092_08400 [Deferrisomatales bacterium]